MLLINSFTVAKPGKTGEDVEQAIARGIRNGMKHVFHLLGLTSPQNFWVDEEHLVREPKRKDSKRTTPFKPYYTVPNDTDHLRIATGTLTAGLEAVSGSETGSETGAIRDIELRDGKTVGIFGVDVTEAVTPFGTPEFDYASLHEAGGVRVRARPFLQPAIDEEEDRIVGIFEREINKELAKI